MRLALFYLLSEELVSVYYSDHHHHITKNIFFPAAFPNFQNDMREKEKFPRAVILGFSGTLKNGVEEKGKRGFLAIKADTNGFFYFTNSETAIFRLALTVHTYSLARILIFWF